MDKFTLVIRILFGVLLLVFGSNKFIGFMEMPMFDGAAGVYMAGLGASGFTFKLIGIVEVLTSIALLSNKFVPLALVIIAPISVNILLFHLFLEPSGIPMGIGVFAFNLILLFANKKSFDSLLSA